MKPVLIWMYHRILPEPGPAAVTPEVFAQQLEYLLEEGYTFLTADQLPDWFDRRLEEQKKYCLLTFDDGWADNWFWATPVLAKFAIKAVLALNTGLVNPEDRLRKKEDYRIFDSKTALADAAYARDSRSFLTWPEVREMANSGLWEIQAHGHSHLGCYQSLHEIRGFFPVKKHWAMAYALGEAPFPGAPCVKFTSTLCAPRTRLHPELGQALRQARTDRERRRLCRSHPQPLLALETAAEFRQRISADLTACKTLIRDQTGREPSALFWPWGQSSSAGREIARACGYRLLFATEKNVLLANQKPSDLIPRLPAPAVFARFRRREKIFTTTLLRKIYRIFTKRRPWKGEKP